MTSLMELNLVIFFNDFICFGHIHFLWSNRDGMSSLTNVDFVLEVFRLFLIGEKTYFVWQS